jgi:hypothetical protein
MVTTLRANTAWFVLLSIDHGQRWSNSVMTVFIGLFPLQLLTIGGGYVDEVDVLLGAVEELARHDLRRERVTFRDARGARLVGAAVLGHAGAAGEHDGADLAHDLHGEIGVLVQNVVSDLLGHLVRHLAQRPQLLTSER